MKEVRSQHPAYADRIYQVPETIEEAERLLNRPPGGSSFNGSIALGFLLPLVGDNEKAYRLYMAHSPRLDRWLADRDKRCR